MRQTVKKRNKVVETLVTLLMTIAILVGVELVTPTLVVQAKDLYAGVTEPMDPNKPHTWQQCGWSWSGETFPIWHETYCSSSCGAHSITWMLMKAGVWGSDKDPRDAWEFISNSGWAYPGSGGYVSMGSTSEGGKDITLMGSGPATKQWITEQYNKGYYVLINVPGHFIALDYVDEDGDVVVLDSAGDRCIFLECAEARWGTGGQAFAYEIEGSNAQESIQLQNGGVVGTANSSKDNKGQNTGCRDGNVDYCADPFGPIKNPIVEFDEDNLTNSNTTNKGLSKNSKGWTDWLFGN